MTPPSDTPRARRQTLIWRMACGRSAFACPVAVNAEIAGRGANGFPAPAKAAWRAALTVLRADAARRQRMGAAGRFRAGAGSGLQGRGPRVARPIAHVASGKAA